MSSKLVVVQEAPPVLKSLSSGQIREFLKAYKQYYQRYKRTEDSPTMQQLISITNLTVMKSLYQMEQQKGNLLDNEIIFKLGENDEESGSEDSGSEEDDDTVNDSVKGKKKTSKLKEDEIESLDMSDELCEEILIKHYGPQNEEAAISLYRGLSMAKTNSFGQLVPASKYLEDWKEMGRWCKFQKIRSRVLIQTFLNGITPRGVGTTIAHKGYKKLSKVMDVFILLYQQCCQAQSLLTSVGVSCDFSSSSIGSSSSSSSRPKPTAGPAVTYQQQQQQQQQKKQYADDKNNTVVGNKNKPNQNQNKLEDVTCFTCGKIGHYSNKCPNKGKSTKRMKLRGATNNVPTVGFYVKGSNSNVHLVCQLDTCAEINLIPYQYKNSLLSAGFDVHTQEEVTVIGITGHSIKVTQYVVLDLFITGVDDNEPKCKDIQLWFADVEQGEVIICWNDIQKYKLMDNLDSIMSIQHAMGVSLSSNTVDVLEPTFEDMDGNECMPVWPMSVDDIDALDSTESCIEVGSGIGIPIVSSDCIIKTDIDVILHEYEHVFGDLPLEGSSCEPMSIEYKDGFEEVYDCSMRQYSPKVMEAIKVELDKQVSLGIIERTESAVAPSHVVMVRKPDSDSGYRFTVDYKLKNKGVVVAKHPIPNVQMVLVKAGGKKYYAKLDLKTGFWQLVVKESDRDKTAFITPHGTYRYKRVPMGHIKSMFHMQREMEKVLRPVLNRGVWIYVDDIGIGADDANEFLVLLREVLTLLDKYKLRLKASKCAIGVKEVMILGHVVNASGVKVSSSRVDKILQIPYPRTTRQLRRFIGMVSYIRRHIPECALLLSKITGKVNEPASELIGVDYEKAIDTIKEAVKSTIQLSHLDYKKTLILRTDASMLGVGIALICRDDTLVEHIVACSSHAFTEAEAKWKTIEQEAFSIYFGVRYFESILWGHHFVVENDHRNLMYIHSGTSAKVIRWSLYLMNFSILFVHIKGTDNVLADILSRDQTSYRVSGARVRALEDLLCEESSNTVAKEVDIPVEKRYEYFLKHHNSTEGHHGIHRTVSELRSRDIDWPKMAKDIAGWIKECAHCQKNRLPADKQKVELGMLGKLILFEELSIDFIGPLPKDDLDNTYICNMVDGFSRFCELEATEAATAICAAHCLLKVVARYGCPRYIRSDRGTHFVNEVITEFLRLFEIQRVLTLADRPQANGIVERNGGEVMRHLRALVTEKRVRTLWSVVLCLIQRIINRTFKQSIQAVPNTLVYVVPPDIDRGIFEPFGSERVLTYAATTVPIQRIQKTYEAILDVTAMHVYNEQERLAKILKVTEPTEYPIGAYVLVSYPARPPSKLADRWMGPYQVVSHDQNNYTIRDLTSNVCQVRDISRLKQFLVAPEIDPSEIAARDLNEEAVRSIISHRGHPKKRTTLEFEVVWEPDGEVTWETWDIMRKTELLNEYLRQHKPLRYLANTS